MMPPTIVYELAVLGLVIAGLGADLWAGVIFSSTLPVPSTLFELTGQVRAPGDRVFATQPGYLRGLFDQRPGWRVTLAKPNRALVLGNWGAFVQLPRPDGPMRLLIRSTVSDARIPAWAAALTLTAFELPHFIIQRTMMLTIKARSERPTT